MRSLIGLFGGTFDPVHLGHLRLALELKQQLAFDRLLLLPCHLPPHRPNPGATSSQRVAMLELALADCSELQLDCRELERTTPSYTYDTLAEVRAQLGPEASLVFCMGTDSFAQLHTWHRWRELLDLAHILVVARPGWELPDEGPLADLLARRGELEDLRLAPAGRLVLTATRLLPISASEIRQLIGEGLSPQFLVPDSVWHYIRTQGLYR